MINYLSSDYIKNTVVPVIISELDRKEDPVASYLDEKKGFDGLAGCLERIKLQYYPRFIDKAACLYLCINKGHFFSNGNKRLALVTLIAFIIENGYRFNPYDKDKYQRKLKELFPDFSEFIYYSDFNSIEFAYYNLSIVVADSKNYVSNFEELKARTKIFLTFSISDTGLKDEPQRFLHSD